MILFDINNLFTQFYNFLSSYQILSILFGT